MEEAMDRLYIDESARTMPLDSHGPSDPIFDIPCRESSGPITLSNNTYCCTVVPGRAGERGEQGERGET